MLSEFITHECKVHAKFRIKGMLKITKEIKLSEWTRSEVQDSDSAN
ncbi:hypothetical protein X975_14582, partial [Stegodyphus mimosarum]